MVFSPDDGGRAHAVPQRDPAEAGHETCAAGVPLKLLSATVSFTDAREMLDAFRHRYVLAHYFAFSIKLLVLVYLLGLTFEPISTVYPAILIGCASALMAGWAYLALMTRWFWSKDTGGVIRLEPGLVGAAMALSGSTWLVKGLIGGMREWSFGQAVTLVVLATVWLMLVTAFLMVRTIPRAAERLRRDREATAMKKPAPKLVSVVPLPEADAAAEPEAEEAAPVSPEHAVLSSVLRLEASGNYVIVVTKKGRKTVPGPFSAVVGRMPCDAGQLVHRSHWVARHAVNGQRRVGRELRLQTVDGESVPVSSSKITLVRAWLAQGRADEGGVT